MGILNQQLIGGGNLKDAERNPFPQSPEREVPSLGFAGYTYAHDETQESVFETTSQTDRVGPVGDVPLGAGTQYGPVGRRIGKDHTTILGQMAEVLKPREDGEAELTWSAGAKMGHTFANGGAVRSLRDTSGIIHGDTVIPAASGGAVPGYDANNQYEISSYITEGSPAVEAVPAVAFQAAVRNMDYTSADFGNVIQEEVAAVDAIEAVAEVKAGLTETFGKVATMNTGLRNLPVAPVAVPQTRNL